jgi:hypothetical protein
MADFYSEHLPTLLRRRRAFARNPDQVPILSNLIEQTGELLAGTGNPEHLPRLIAESVRRYGELQ